VLGIPGRIDHHDGDGLNNQRLNLRPATHAQNMANRAKRSDASSQFKGVWWTACHQKWRAVIRANGVRHQIGYFREEVNAATAYNLVAHELHGEFARFNLPITTEEKA
jgi:hypothetical protein